MKDDSPAFPTWNVVDIKKGMTLRDYFAAVIVAKFYDDEYISFDELARASYNLADAMMEARK